jgi:hypothetical protein
MSSRISYQPWTERQAEFQSSVNRMSSRISIIREQNIKQNFNHAWTEYKVEFLSCCEQNIKQNFNHPWTECQSEFQSSLNRMSSIISVIREQKVDQNLYLFTKKNRQSAWHPSKLCPQVFEGNTDKNHCDAKSSIPVSVWHQSSQKFYMYLSFTALLTKHLLLLTFRKLCVRSQTFCYVKLCEVDNLVYTPPQQKLHVKCK